MSYEPGSLECRSLIDAKENILNAMSSLNSSEEANNIRAELLNMYNQLEKLHESCSIPIQISRIYIHPIKRDCIRI